MAISVGGWQESTRLIGGLVKAHAGAASWLIGEAISNYERMGSDQEEVPSAAANDALTARLRQATTAWANALPTPFARLGIGPGAEEGRDFRVSVVGDTCSVEMLRVDAAGMTVAVKRLTRQVSRAPNWPWRLALDLGQGSIADHLKGLRWNPCVQSLEHETQFDIFNGLVPSGFSPAEYAAYERLTRVQYLRHRIDYLAGIMNGDEIGRIQVGGGHHARSYSLRELRALREKLENAEGRVLASPPWPDPDSPPANEAFWRNYSAARLEARVAAVYTAALKGYLEVVARWYPQLAPTMSLAALAPLRLVGDLVVSEGVAGLKYTFEALNADSGSFASIRASLERQVVDLDDGPVGPALIGTRPESASWIRIGRAWSRLDIGGRMPASRISVGWLWRDFANLHLVSGSAPHD
jgi:hypothetical protein